MILDNQNVVSSWKGNIFMKTKSIEYFLAVVEDMSFTKAAQRLYISQQALSGHIQRLEEEYNVTLFERKPTLRLTEAGRMMAFYGQQILRSERYMQQAFADISTNCRGSLIVGMSRLRGSVVFPTLYERYHKRHPNIAVELVGGNTADLETMLMNNKLDVYLGLDAAPNPFETRLPIGQERTFCILTRRLLLEHYPDTWQDKLEQLKQEARLADLVDLPLITLRTGARLRASVDRVLSGIRKPDFLIECDQSTVAYKLALRNMGVALLSPVAQCLRVHELEAPNEVYSFPLMDPPLENTLYIVYRSDFPPVRHIMDFIQLSRVILQNFTTQIQTSPDIYAQSIW